MTNGHDDKYSHWESNPDQRFRKPPFYPLNYESIGVRRGVFRPDKKPVFCLARGASDNGLKRQQQRVGCAKIM